MYSFVSGFDSLYLKSQVREEIFSLLWNCGKTLMSSAKRRKSITISLLNFWEMTIKNTLKKGWYSPYKKLSDTVSSSSSAQLFLPQKHHLQQTKKKHLSLLHIIHLFQIRQHMLDEAMKLINGSMEMEQMVQVALQFSLVWLRPQRLMPLGRIFFSRPWTRTGWRYRRSNCRSLGTRTTSWSYWYMDVIWWCMTTSGKKLVSTRSKVSNYWWYSKPQFYWPGRNWYWTSKSRGFSYSQSSISVRDFKRCYWGICKSWLYSRMRWCKKYDFCIPKRSMNSTISWWSRSWNLWTKNKNSLCWSI